MLGYRNVVYSDKVQKNQRPIRDICMKNFVFYVFCHIFVKMPQDEIIRKNLWHPKSKKFFGCAFGCIPGVYR